MCQYIINRAKQFTLRDLLCRATSSADSINEYNGFFMQRPMGKFGQDARVTPLLYFEGHPGIFNDHRESGVSGPQFNVSSEGRCLLTV